MYKRQPGTPWVYYGEEIGAPNGTSWGDMGRREPMLWNPGNTEFSSTEPWTGSEEAPAYTSVEEQIEAEDSLLSWYRTLIKQRREHDSLRRGSAEWLKVEPDAVALLRESAEETCLVLVPLSEESQTFTVMLPEAGTGWQSQLSEEGFDISSEGIALTSQGGGARLLCKPEALNP